MIPIRLEIEGLYSYREKQVIEFDSLTAAGLFGIFGAVGSGKSAILEGVLIALYGHPERVSASGERASMVNLQHSEVDLKLTFRSGQNNARTYLARYHAKRNKKDAEKIETAAHVFYEWVGEEWKATDKKAEELIGMSKENFKQTIIIPQGKFREFIDQKPLERAEMMQQLFGLDRFDLSAQTGSLLKATRDQKIRLDTQLQGLEDISSELREAKEQEFVLLSQEKIEANRLLESLAAALKKMEGARKSFLELQELRLLQERLNAQLPEMAEKRQLYRDFLNAKTYLRPIHDRIQDLEKDLEKYKVSLTDCTRFKGSFAEEIEKLLQEEGDLQKVNELRPQREAKIRDLKKVMEIQALTGNQSQHQKEVDALLPSLESQTKEIQALEQEITNLEGTQAQLPNADPSLLVDLKTSQLQLQAQHKRLEELKLILQEEETQLANSDSLLTQLTNKVPSMTTSLEAWLEIQKSEVKQLENLRENLLRTQGLAAHTHLLESGLPCPLCGSAEHPQPLQSGESTDALQRAEIGLQQAVGLLDEIRNFVQQKEREEIQRDNRKKNLLEKLTEQQSLRSQQEAIEQKLQPLGIVGEAQLLERIGVLSQAHQKAEGLQNQLQALRKTLTTKRNTKEKEAELLQQAQLANQDLLSRIAGKKQEIKDQEFCDPYLEKTADAILKAITTVEQNIEAAATSLVGLQKHLQEKKIAQSKNEADLANYQELVRTNESRFTSAKKEFETQRLAHGFADIDQLLRLFQHDLDAEKTDAELRKFDQQVVSTQTRIQALIAAEGEEMESYSAEAFATLQQEVAAAQAQEKMLQAQVTLLEQQCKEISAKLEEKEKLTAAFLAVETRESHLRELEKLFSGKGFVKYVSSIYLRELCNTANKRFMTLTKNSLRLEIDDSNTFWVVDYLNGGKKRLLKTLSGGQTFQASLCLALALAEKVKALNQADQSFFFLDEGFGALDKNSLRVVFETLKALRHENRVVGIISHVEELQQEIGVYAQIELDPEKGSQISYSY
jgi:exonuclease SbcC